MMTLTRDTSELEKLFDLPPKLALQEAVPIVSHIVKEPEFMHSQVLHLLEQGEQARDWYVARRHNGKDRSYSLQIFVWPPGTETKIHDHASWGALCCVVGSIEEVRYERFDDGRQPNHARLREIWRREWSKGAGISTVLPYEEGIHRIGNPGPSMAVSVHLYGPRMGRLDGRDYDPSRDYVCSRLEVRGFVGCVKKAKRTLRPVRSAPTHTTNRESLQWT